MTANRFRILMLTAGMAAAADFPHRLHVDQGMDCTSCHGSALTSTKAEDNNLPKSEACATCHGGMAIKEPRATKVARFNHQAHLKARTCTQCHHGIETSERSSEANYPSMAECVQCHAVAEIPNGCYQCHAKSMKLTPSSHVSGFVEGHGKGGMSAAEKQACGVCHGKVSGCAGCH